MKKNILALFVCSQVVYAAPPEPQPYTTTPPPPGLPIDTGIYVLIFMGLLFTFFKFKSHLQHKKTPM